MTAISQYIAERIRHRLAVLRISNQDFAAMVGVQPSSVTRWLSGTHNFTIETLQKIQNALNINFFSYSEQVNPCFPCIADDFLKAKN